MAQDDTNKVHRLKPTSGASHSWLGLDDFTHQLTEQASAFEEELNRLLTKNPVIAFTGSVILGLGVGMWIRRRGDQS